MLGLRLSLVLSMSVPALGMRLDDAVSVAPRGRAIG
jgi:hypothetical protein